MGKRLRMRILIKAPGHVHIVWFLVCVHVADRSAMSTKVPYLSRLGIYRISIEKQETLLKLMALSTAAILCEEARTSSLKFTMVFNSGSLSNIMCIRVGLLQQIPTSSSSAWH